MVLAKHLTKLDIEAIINIISGWKGKKLTWDGISEASEAIVGKKTTRQSLCSNELIKEAYRAKKKGLMIRGPRVSLPSNLNVAAERINKLQNEIDTLTMKNSALMEQFVIWQYNAYKYGLKEHQLNESLPRIDRERTE